MLIIGHRGLARVPENTLTAFKAAYEEGADGIEFDVIEGVDDFFVFHDEKLDEKTTGGGSTASLARAFAKRTYYKGSSETIPTLKEVLDAILPFNFRLINLEIKSLDPQKLEVLLTEIMTREDIYRAILISSHNLSYIRKIKEYCPSIQTAPVLYHQIKNFEELLREDLDSFSIEFNLVTDKLVSVIKENNKQLFIWTVNKEEEVKKCVNWKVDGIITDFPKEAREWANGIAKR